MSCFAQARPIDNRVSINNNNRSRADADLLKLFFRMVIGKAGEMWVKKKNQKSPQMWIVQQTNAET